MNRWLQLIYVTVLYLAIIFAMICMAIKGFNWFLVLGIVLALLSIYAICKPYKEKVMIYLLAEKVSYEVDF